MTFLRSRQSNFEPVRVLEICCLAESIGNNIWSMLAKFPDMSGIIPSIRIHRKALKVSKISKWKCRFLEEHLILNIRLHQDWHLAFNDISNIKPAYNMILFHAILITTPPSDHNLFIIKVTCTMCTMHPWECTYGGTQCNVHSKMSKGPYGSTAH